MENKPQESSQCVACCHPIIPHAAICAQCGQSQQFFKYRVIGQWLTWLGGIVTLISLMLGAITLNQWYRQNQEQQTAIAEMVEAAGWLVETENYSQAWQMFEQARKLNSSAENVRIGQTQLALQWLRNFTIEKKHTDQRLQDISMLLYRALPSAGSQQFKATLLASIGYIQAIRLAYQLPIVVDVDALFARALSLDSNNSLANSMSARWLLLQRPVTVNMINKAQQKYTLALNDVAFYDFVRRTQFNSLVSFTYGYDSDIEIAALTYLLSSAIEMMQKGEPKPDGIIRQKILEAYGRMAKAEHVDILVGKLDPEQHLAVYHWLQNNYYAQRPQMQYQESYLLARLYQANKDADKALGVLNSLTPLPLNKYLREKVALAITQLSTH